MTNKNNALKKLICNRPMCSCYVPPADLAGFSPIIFLGPVYMEWGTPV